MAVDGVRVLKLNVPHINDKSFHCIKFNNHFYTIVPDGLSQLKKLPIQEVRRRRAENQRAYYHKRKQQKQEAKKREQKQQK